jgi:hypothetical protein
MRKLPQKFRICFRLNTARSSDKVKLETVNGGGGLFYTATGCAIMRVYAQNVHFKKSVKYKCSLRLNHGRARLPLHEQHRPIKILKENQYLV